MHIRRRRVRLISSLLEVFSFHDVVVRGDPDRLWIGWWCDAGDLLWFVGVMVMVPPGFAGVGIVRVGVVVDSVSASSSRTTLGSHHPLTYLWEDKLTFHDVKP